MPYPDKDQPKADAPKADAPKAAAPVAPRAAVTPEEKEAVKAWSDQVKEAKAAVSKAPDGDLKDEAQRGVDQAEALFADGHDDRAQTALKQAQAVLKNS
jgi:hypothetical protein